MFGVNISSDGLGIGASLLCAIQDFSCNLSIQTKQTDVVQNGQRNSNAFVETNEAVPIIPIGVA